MKEKALHRTGWRTRFGRDRIRGDDDQIGDNY